MNLALRAGCRLFDCLLALYPVELRARYGGEMRQDFENLLEEASNQGLIAVAQVWLTTVKESIAVVGTAYSEPFALAASSVFAAAALFTATLLGFCTIGVSGTVQANTVPITQQMSPNAMQAGKLVPLADGRHMFLECSGDPSAEPTVILANGKGLGTADAWAKVQQLVPPSIRTCSYDAIGAGQSDHVQQPHPELRPIDQVVSEMHDLFQTAQLKRPYVLVGASAGGILIRRYQQQHPNEIAGLVFVDSAHEEQAWRIAAISKEFDPNWNNPESLRENGFLPDHQKLTWHADIPLIVLERTEKPPCSAFPGLSQQQCDALNDEWHNHQVDLAARSRYGQLRSVAGSGHIMHQQRPGAIAEAVKDVVREIQRER